MAVARRNLLKYGLGGTLLLTLGGVGVGLRSSQLIEPRRTLQVLDQQQFSVLCAVADAILPAHPGFPSHRDVLTVERIDAALEASRPDVQAEFGQLLLLLENAVTGLVLDLRPTPFTRCSLPIRSDVLASWRDGRVGVLRQGFKAMHGYCTGTYWTSPEVFRASGYPGPQPWLVEQIQRLNAAELGGTHRGETVPGAIEVTP